MHNSRELFSGSSRDKMINAPIARHAVMQPSEREITENKTSLDNMRKEIKQLSRAFSENEAQQLRMFNLLIEGQTHSKSSQDALYEANLNLKRQMALVGDQKRHIDARDKELKDLKGQIYAKDQELSGLKESPKYQQNKWLSQNSESAGANALIAKLQYLSKELHDSVGQLKITQTENQSKDDEILQIREEVGKKNREIAQYKTYNEQLKSQLQAATVQATPEQLFKEKPMEKIKDLEETKASIIDQNDALRRELQSKDDHIKVLNDGLRKRKKREESITKKNVEIRDWKSYTEQLKQQHEVDLAAAKEIGSRDILMEKQALEEQVQELNNVIEAKNTTIKKWRDYTEQLQQQHREEPIKNTNAGILMEKRALEKQVEDMEHVIEGTDATIAKWHAFTEQLQQKHKESITKKNAEIRDWRNYTVQLKQQHEAELAAAKENSSREILMEKQALEERVDEMENVIEGKDATLAKWHASTEQLQQQHKESITKKNAEIRDWQNYTEQLKQEHEAELAAAKEKGSREILMEKQALEKRVEEMENVIETKNATIQKWRDYKEQQQQHEKDLMAIKLQPSSDVMNEMAGTESAKSDKGRITTELRRKNRRSASEQRPRQVAERPPAPKQVSTRELWCLNMESAGANPMFCSAVAEFLKEVTNSLSCQQKVLHTLSLKPENEIPEEAQRTLSKPILMIVPCLVTSRVHSCITSALSKIKANVPHSRLLVLYHPRAEHDKRVPPTRQQLGTTPLHLVDLIVDVVFDRRTGQVYKDAPNTKAVAEMTQHLNKDHAVETTF